MKFWQSVAFTPHEHLAPIARVQRDLRCEPAAGACTCNGDPSRVDAVEFREPGEGRVGIVECRRERVLGRQSVYRCDDDRAELVRDLATERVILLRRPKQKAAAVEPQHGWQRFIPARCRPMDADGARSRIVDLDVLRIRTASC